MKKNSSKKLILALIITLLAGGALVFLFINDFGVVKYYDMKTELNKIQADINRADFTLDSLKNEIDSLQRSKMKIERTAREKFDMHRSNEKALKITEK